MRVRAAATSRFIAGSSTAMKSIGPGPCVAEFPRSPKLPLACRPEAELEDAADALVIVPESGLASIAETSMVVALICFGDRGPRQLPCASLYR